MPVKPLIDESRWGHWDVSAVGPFSPDDFVGFVYEIEHLSTGRSYIGKKSFKSKRRKTKRNKARYQESDWKEYCSSCTPLKYEIEQRGRDQFAFRILAVCSGKSLLTYTEEEYQFKRDVLRSRLPDGTKKFFNNAVGYKLYAGLEKQTRESAERLAKSQTASPS